MTPPIEGATVNNSAPLSKWVIKQSFDSAGLCEASLNVNHEEAETAWLQNEHRAAVAACASTPNGKTQTAMSELDGDTALNLLRPIGSVSRSHCIAQKTTAFADVIVTRFR